MRRFVSRPISTISRLPSQPMKFIFMFLPGSNFTWCWWFTVSKHGTIWRIRILEFLLCSGPLAMVPEYYWNEWINQIQIYSLLLYIRIILLWILDIVILLDSYYKLSLFPISWAAEAVRPAGSACPLTSSKCISGAWKPIFRRKISSRV